MSNSTGGANFWVSEDTLSDGWIRGLFKTYFIVLAIFIALAGNAVNRYWVKHKLLSGKTVLLTQTVGWVHGPSLAKLIFEIRKLPGGWLGCLMVLMTALDLIGDYGVAITVTTDLRAGTRVFTTGGIMDATKAISEPSPDWEAFRWAADAQKNNYVNANRTNSGFKHYGIYRMVTNDTNFMATADDTIGWWSCSPSVKEPIVYDQNWKNPDMAEIYDYDIWTDLWEKGLMYGDANSAWAVYNVSRRPNGISVGPASRTTIITSNNNVIGELFNISAAIDIHDIDALGSKEMYVFHCELRATDAARTAETIAKAIDTQAALNNWASEIMGAMYPGMRGSVSNSLKDLETTLQFYMNALTMVSGVDETVTNPNVDQTPVGIVYRATKIPYWVVIVCILVWLLASFLTSVCIYLWFITKAQAIVHDHKNKDGMQVSGQEIKNNTPVGMLDWMTHAAYESRDAQQIPKRSQLKNWILSTTWHAGRRLAIVRLSEQGQVNPLKTPSMTSMGQSPSVSQTGYFPQTKGEYVSVQSREVSS